MLVAEPGDTADAKDKPRDGRPQSIIRIVVGAVKPGVKHHDVHNLHNLHVCIEGNRLIDGSFELIIPAEEIIKVIFEFFE